MANKTRILEEKLAALGDPQAIEVLARLHAQADRQIPKLVARMGGQLPRWALGKRLSWDRLAPRMADLYLALDPDNGLWCYLLARALGARRIVEFGTAMGISTIYFALAVRDNGGGTVIGTELVAAKAERARQNLADAGVLPFVDLRVGDALATLTRDDGPIDLVLNDGFPPAVLPVLQLLSPRLRQGAVVLCGNAAVFPADHADYLRWVRDPANGFRSMHLPMRFAGEFSVKAGDP